MIFFNTVMFFVACGTFSVYACRLEMLRHGIHNMSIIVMHKAMACAVIYAGYDAWRMVATFGDMAFVIAAITWIVVSYKTWREDVPAHFWL